MTSDRIDALIASAVLGELSTDERLELDEAVRSNPAVAIELDDALATAATLQRPHAEAPPSALRDSVLAAIADTPQDAAVTESVDPPRAAAPSRAAAPAALATAAPPESEPTRRRRRPLLLAAAAVAVLVAGAVVVVATDDEPTDPIATVLDAPDATSRSLAGEIDGLTVTYSASEQALVVRGQRVPVLGATATYQLWLVGDDGAISVGLFRPDADGTVSERFADADPTGFVLGVTQEPARGSRSPTLPILASA